MHQEILSSLHQPGQLEKLYRSNQAAFKKEFTSLYPEIKGNEAAEFWHERLNYEADPISWGSKKDLQFVFILILIAGLFAKFPAFFSIEEDFFYLRNVSFIVLPMITAYFAWKNNIALNTKAILAGVTGLTLVYINSLPGMETDTLILACIHLPILLWAMLGVAFTGNELKNPEKKLSFLRFNGDTAVMSVLLGLSGIALTGLTFGLFKLIGIKIEEFYINYVVVFGLPAVPIFATYLTQTNPQLVNKVSPIIAKIFSPLVLVMLVIYLGAIVLTGKDPYNDREFLLIFNLLLLGVMGLIFFSVAESSAKETGTSGTWILLSLSIITVIVNGIALSAIIFRISEWGITPNRMAVLGANLLILIHLLMVTRNLFKAATKKEIIGEVGKTIVGYLPVYIIWAAIVVFLFPMIFGFN